MPDQLSAYQKASRFYMQIMALIILFLCAVFIYRIYIDGEGFNPFFIFLAIVSMICLLVILRAPDLAAKFSKEHPDKERRSWEFRNDYVIIISFVMGPVILYIAKTFHLDMKFALALAWFFFCFSFFYYGLDAYRHGILYGRDFFAIIPTFVAKGEKAKKLGIILMWFSIIAFVLFVALICVST